MWRIRGTRAELESGDLNCTIDLARPSSGLINPMLRQQEQACWLTGSSLLQVHTGETEGPETLEDFYVRSGDLIVTYRETAAGGVRLQICWKYQPLEQQCATALELVLSVQTSKLDSRPSLEIVSSLPEAPSCRADGISLFPLGCPTVSYAETAHPSNLAEAEARPDNSAAQQWLSTHRFFAGRLEKGVIRRGVLRAIFAWGERREETVHHLYQDLLQATPPLTT